MIKLKNLWKIALATMAMSAMLVACDTTGSDDGKKNDDDPLAKYKTNPVAAKADSFTYGFKFCTEDGWACQYTSATASTAAVDKVYAKLGGDAAAIATTAKDKAAGDALNDDSTKIYVDSGELTPKAKYTLTYDKKNGTVKLTEAAADAKATSTTHQTADAEGNFPAGIYINGYLGANWADADNAKEALLMDVVDAANEVYAFTWEAPAATITVTLKITMDVAAEGDTPASSSILYLRDVPVKNDGTSAIDGSIFSWNEGAAVTIKNEDNSIITGGIYDAAMTAKSNAAWALNNYVNGNENVNIAEKFGLTGADDVLQLSIDAEKWVPYVKGSTSTFSWKNAQGKLEAPKA